MISVIISSKEPKLAESVKENIQESIDVDHEVLIINNQEGKLPIFKAYNRGIYKARGELLCFLHEDVKIHTTGWGKIVIDIFEQHPKIGLLGIAGSKYKTRMPSPWWETPESAKSVNIIQHLNDEVNSIVRWDYGFEKDTEEVVTLDGVFMAMKRQKDLFFNEGLPGFHNYDLDMALKVQQKGLEIYVTNRILIEHFSIGKLDKSWYLSTLAFQNKYQQVLPFKNLLPQNKKLQKEWELKNGIDFIQGLLVHGYKKEAFKYWSSLRTYSPGLRGHLNLLKTLSKRCWQS